MLEISTMSIPQTNPASGLNLQSDDYILTDLVHELEK
jgi:hypothetical protein